MKLLVQTVVSALSLLLLLLGGVCHGWVQQHPSIPSSKTLRRPSQTVLLYSSNSHEESDENKRKKKEHMEMVRSLQVAFYGSPSSSSSSSSSVSSSSSSTVNMMKSKRSRRHLDLSTGILYHLPLWRVGWTEVPGRTNVLNVHEPMYTNMFESIVRSEPPWFVGHLYLSGGSSNLKRRKTSNGENNNHDAFRLQTWEQRTLRLEQREQNKTIFSSPSASSSAVVGTLLKIVDYRRMEDGKLLLLVQAMERFVVTHVVQELPYGVAHVQLLPDAEEMIVPQYKDDGGQSSSDSAVVIDDDNATRRARALQESFHRWHRYEYENTMLPLPLSQDLSATQVLGSALAKVLPYAPFSSVVKVDCLASERVSHSPSALPASTPPTGSSPELSSTRSTSEQQQQQHSEALSSRDDPLGLGSIRRLSYNNELRMDASSATTLPQNSTNSLEYRLEQARILSKPDIDPHLLQFSMDQLEVRIWVVLDRYLKITKKAVSPILLGLLPHDVSWPETFVLERIADAIEEQQFLDHKYVRVSPHFPALRRQKRLSFSAAALLEQVDTVNAFRQRLLEIPLVHVRLAYILQCLQDQVEAFQ